MTDALVALTGILALIAFAVTGYQLVVQRSDEKKELERRQTELCYSINASRESQYNSNMKLATLALGDRTEDIPFILIEFVRYTKLAFDPLSCDPDSPLFSFDPTPPPPVSIPSVLEEIQ